MLNSKTLDKLIFLDCETTSQYPTFEHMPDNFKVIFRKRFRNEYDKIKPEYPGTEAEVWEKIYSEKSPLYAEWAKLVCISIGYFEGKLIGNDYQGDLILKTKSFFGEDEKKLLTDFHSSLKSVLDSIINPSHHFVAHAAKLFDFPMIAKRFILNSLPLPNLLDYSHKKPWETDFIVCTLETWKYGQFDGGITLDMLAASFGLESSKSIMDGSMVKDMYWIEKDLNKIERYCVADIKVLSEVYLRLKNMQNKVILG